MTDRTRLIIRFGGALAWWLGLMSAVVTLAVTVDERLPGWAYFAVLGGVGAVTFYCTGKFADWWWARTEPDGTHDPEKCRYCVSSRYGKDS